MSAAIDPLLRAVSQWVGKAGHDMLNAKHTLTMGKDCPYDTVCFHAQQAVEKYIKAVLVHDKIDFAKTHDVGELAILLPNGRRPAISKEERTKLSDYAIAARYPGVHEDLARQDAEEAVRIAERIQTWAQGLLPAEAPGVRWGTRS